MVNHDGHHDNLSMSTVISFMEGITLMCPNVSIINNTKDTELMWTCFLSKGEDFLPLIGPPLKCPSTPLARLSLLILLQLCLLGIEVLIVLNVKRIEVREAPLKESLLGIVSAYCLKTLSKVGSWACHFVLTFPCEKMKCCPENSRHGYPISPPQESCSSYDTQKRKNKSTGVILNYF